MCRRCLFWVDPNHRDLLSLREETHYDEFTPNQEQERLLNLCRHDKKRVAWARKLTSEPNMIRDRLIYSLQRGIPLVPHAELLVNYGQTFATPDFSEEWSTLDDAWGKCYSMACGFSRAHPDVLLYAEGLTLTHITGALESMHAWNVIQHTGEVYDPTWPMSHWHQYFGIVFDLDWVKENCEMECGIFHPDYWPHNEERVRHYLQLKWLESAKIRR